MRQQNYGTKLGNMQSVPALSAHTLHFCTDVRSRAFTPCALRPLLVGTAHSPGPGCNDRTCPWRHAACSALFGRRPAESRRGREAPDGHLPSLFQRVICRRSFHGLHKRVISVSRALAHTYIMGLRRLLSTRDKSSFLFPDLDFCRLGRSSA